MAYSIDPVNAAPKTIFLGIDDASERVQVAVSAPRPTHLPLCPLWCAWGDTEPQVLNGNTAKLVHGDETFDMRSKYANHQTLYANLFIGHANTIITKRLLPDDIGPKATLRLSIDVLEKEIDVREREVDGSFKMDAMGDYVLTGDKVPGFEVKWTVSQIVPGVTGESGVGTGTVGIGDQTDPTSGTSTRYPVLDMEVPFYGSYGNGFGMALYAPTTRSPNPVNTRMVSNDKTYPYRINMWRKSKPTATPRILETQAAAQFVEVSFKEGAEDTSVEADRYIGDVLLDSYRNMSPMDPFAAPTHGPFGRMYVYQENIELLLEKFFTAEEASPYPENELAGLDVEDKHLFNFVSGVTSENVPYQTFRLAEALGTDGIRLTENTIVYASGATDGTMNNDKYAQAVSDLFEEIGSPTSQWNNTVDFPMSFFYDSGLPLAVKRKCANFISNLKSTILIMSTHVDGEDKLTAVDEHSRAISLLTALEASPESIYFGTSVCRAVIVGRHGKLVDKSYKKYVGCNYELADKIAAFAGASNGIWKQSKLFDRVPVNYLTKIRDLNVTWVPVDTRNADWAVGMMWPENIERRTPYFPATQTIYKDDTSTLKSLLMVMACAECQYVGDQARRVASGGNRSKAELKEFVEEFVKENVKSRFCELFTIIPEVTFTNADVARNYSWTLTIRVYGTGMQTVETLIIEAHNDDDIPANNNGVLA